MKKFLALALAFIMALTLIACGEKPAPTPDPDPAPEGNVYNVVYLVNGNLGAGVAVMGAFSLVRFRSAAGSAREIAAIFLAMAIGLCTGMGYIGIAAILLAVYAAVSLTLNAMRFGEKRRPAQILRITIPESLDYDGVFDETLETYTKKHELSRVRTVRVERKWIPSEVMKKDRQLVEAAGLDITPEQGIL